MMFYKIYVVSKYNMFEILMLIFILLETVQPIKFYKYFYNWLNNSKIISLEVLFFF